MTTSTEEARALLIQARVDLAKQTIVERWAGVLIEALEAQEMSGSEYPDFRHCHFLDHLQLVGMAESYYGARMSEIECIDNIEAFTGMVAEAIGDQLAEFDLAPQIFRSHQTGQIRMYLLRPCEHPTA